MKKRYVGYTRVSTDKQGKEGYGSADQLQTINEFVKNDELLQVFQEEESGSRNDRPQLTQALELCKKEKATLVIARLDRLSRNLAFTASLMESKIEFVCCDMPSVNKFTIQVLAAVAEQYLDTLRKNTKSALAQAKKRGVVLGNTKNLKQAARKGNAKKKLLADEKARSVNNIILDLKKYGVTTLSEIAKALNARGIPTVRNGEWYPSTVRNYVNRCSVNVHL
jgi:DNA invertase Pin-like site-specific DNA recombinase|tara:strand:- start:758 stop:1426 length:669 start_codon:yes stop_codon:yes gene_type:complete